jgi:hypothetical protein
MSKPNPSSDPPPRSSIFGMGSQSTYSSLYPHSKPPGTSAASSASPSGGSNPAVSPNPPPASTVGASSAASAAGRASNPSTPGLRPSYGLGSAADRSRGEFGYSLGLALLAIGRNSSLTTMQAHFPPEPTFLGLRNQRPQQRPERLKIKTMRTLTPTLYHLITTTITIIMSMPTPRVNLPAPHPHRAVPRVIALPRRHPRPPLAPHLSIDQLGPLQLTGIQCDGIASCLGEDWAASSVISSRSGRQGNENSDRGSCSSRRKGTQKPSERPMKGRSRMRRCSGGHRPRLPPRPPPSTPATRIDDPARYRHHRRRRP